MSIRARLQKKATPADKSPTDPKWIINGSGTTKALYQSTIDEYRRLVKSIKSGESKSPKDRKLVLARIAKLAGRDRSIVTPRRQPELCDFIDRLNDELEVLTDIHRAAKKPTKSRSKRELEREISVLRKELKKEAELVKRAIIEEFFASNLLDDRDKQASEIIRLRTQKKELMEKVSRLTQINHQISRENATLHELLTSSQRAKMQGLKLVQDRGGESEP